MTQRDDASQTRITALEAMLEETPDDTFALYGLALEHKAKGDLDAAEPLLRKVLELDSAHHYAYYQLGEVLIGDDRLDEAEAVLAAGADRARADGEATAAGERLALLDTI